MHVVVRTYSGEGASALFDLLEQRVDEVKEIMTSVPGFHSYVAFRHNGGGITVTTCNDKAGTDESSSRAAEWVRNNVTATISAPSITEGDTSLQF